VQRELHALAGCIKDSGTRGRDKTPRDAARRRISARIMHAVNYFRAIEQKARAEESGMQVGGRGGRSSLTDWPFDACAVARLRNRTIGISMRQVRGSLFQAGKRESGGKPQRGIKDPASDRLLGFRPLYGNTFIILVIIPPQGRVYAVSPRRSPTLLRGFSFLIASRSLPSPRLPCSRRIRQEFSPSIVRPAKRGFSSLPARFPAIPRKSREDRHSSRGCAISRSL